MSYIALYRNYRPTKFSEVAGQKHIIKTLKNAVINDKISHAYIFSGQRGIGKTTIARILAKAVNCLNPLNGEPCNECVNCKRIINNETSDIIEIDAASNNGVDEMRSLLEKVNFLPSNLKRKVYIIDEVHMLSMSAFNALLKTLEEPPTHIMFILATTEPHKIPMTILSRCQRFDFKQLSNLEIVNRLKEINQAEQIDIEEEALYAIAESSEGGMRDAVSTLDQVNSFANQTITIDDVNSVTGRISNYKLIEVLKALNNHQAQESLKIINELLDMGKEVSHLTNNLVQFCRDILLYKNGASEKNKKNIYNTLEFKEIADDFDTQTLFYYIDVLMDANNKLKYANSSKIYLEVAIMKLVSTYKEDLDVLGKLTELEERINNGGVGTSRGISKESELRISELEMKVKKIVDEINRLNLTEFKESTLGKIALFEELTTSAATLPKELNYKIENIENNIKELEITINAFSSNKPIEENENNKQDNINVESLVSQIAELETKINEIETKSEQNVVVEKEESTNPNQLDEYKTELINLENRLKSLETSQSNEQNQMIEKKFSEIDLNIEQITNQLIEFEEMLVNNHQTLPNATNDNSDVSYYMKEVNELKENYFTIIEKIQELLPSNNGNYEDEDLNYPEIANETTPEVVVNIDKEELSREISNTVLNDALEAIGFVKQELEEKILNNSNDIIKINETIGSILQKIENDHNKTALEEINAKLVTLEEKTESLANQSMDETIKDIYKYVDDLKEYNLKLSHKFQELQKSFEKNLSKETEVQQPTKVIKSETPVIINTEPIVETKPEPVQETKIEPVKLEPVQETKLESIKPEVSKVPSKPTLDVQEVNETAKVYDIRIVENILHESRYPEMRNEKATLSNNWNKLTNNAGPILMASAKILQDGTLIANGKKQLLIVYPSASICNHLMSQKTHQEVKEILKLNFGKEYDFIALPENTWQEKRKEYYGQYSMGFKYPKLSPINNPELKIITLRENKETKEGTYNKAVSIFGKQITRRED